MGEHERSDGGDVSAPQDRSGQGRPDLLGVIEHHMHESVEEAEFAYDAEYAQDALDRVASRWNAYFDSEVRGIENVPESGPVLLVANHSGGYLSPDTAAVLAAWYERRGVDDPLVILAFDGLFFLPYVAEFISRIGGVPASWEHAEKALVNGRSALVYPGGDWEVFRPVWHRNRIDFAGRHGFVRLALKLGVPVVPVVGHGAHNTTWVMARGDRIARALRLDRHLRVKIFPFSAFPPFGIMSSWLPHVPLPAKITVEIGKAFDWSDLGPDAAEDESAVQACYNEITSTMQATLTRLARAQRFPVIARVRSAFGSPVETVRRVVGPGPSGGG